MCVRWHLRLDRCPTQNNDTGCVLRQQSYTTDDGRQVAALTEQLTDFGLSSAKKYAMKKQLAMAKSKAIRLRRQIAKAASQ